METQRTVTVETLSFAEFERLAHAWDDLAAAVETPSPFLCHAWLRAWWRHFGVDDEFVAFVVRDGDTLLAAVPLAVRRSGATVVAEIVGTGPVPTRGMGLADKADVLIRGGDTEAGERLVAGMAGLLDRADLLDVKGFDDTSATRRLLEETGAPRFFVRSVSPFLALPSWEEILRTRSRNFRKHLKKYWRLLEEAGAMEVARMEPDADVTAWVAEAFAVNDSSWKAQRGTNLFRAPWIRAFFEDAIPALAAEGKIDLHVIRLDGVAAAYELCFDFAGKLFSYNGAYRVDLDRGSPGTALTAAVIESACTRGRREYDMLRGAESYKLRWSETARTELQAIVPAPRALSRLKALFGPVLKAHVKASPWLSERADRLAGRLSRLRYRG